jgi:hypothetical protein
MWSTVLMLLVVVLAGWAVASVLRAPRPGPDPQAAWEHWLESSGLRPVLPRTRPVAEAATALGRHPAEVDRAAMGRAGDQSILVVAQLVDGTVLVAAQRPGPVPTDAATAVVDGWQLRLTADRLDDAWRDARWLRTGPATAR